MFYKSSKGVPFHPIGSTGYVDVRDLSLLALRSLQQPDSPERMIANGSNHTLGFIMGQISILAGKKPPSLAMPKWASELLWRLLLPTEWITGKEPLLSKSAARTTACKQTFDNTLSLSVKEFKYTPVERSLQDVMDNFAIAKEKNLCPVPMDFLEHHLA